MAEGGKQVSARKDKGQKKRKTKHPIECPICAEINKGRSGKTCGDDTIYCGGKYDAWLHRR